MQITDKIGISKIVHANRTIRKDKLITRKGHFVPAKATIRTKLIAAFIVPIVCIIILGIVSYKKAEQGLVDSYERSTSQAINMTSEYLQFGVQSVDDLSIQYMNDDTMRNYISGFYSKDVSKNNNAYQDLINAAMSKEVTDDFIKNIYVLSPKVNPISTVANLREDIYSGFLDTERGTSIKQDDSSLWVGSDMFLDEKLGTDAGDYSIRLIRNFKKANALIVIDMDASTVLTILKSLQFEMIGTLVLVTSDGKEINSLEQPEAQNTIFTGQDFYQKALVSKVVSKADYVDYKGKTNLFIYSKIGDTGAMLCALIPKSTISKQADSIKTMTVIIVIIACIIAVMIGLFISVGIDKTIKDIISKLKKAAKGDLTVDFGTKRRDEFRLLIDEIKDTFTNMKELISQVRDFSKDVSQASQKVSNTSENFLNSTKDISMAMGEIEQGVTQQAKDAQECLLHMDHLSQKIELMSDNTNEIGKIANQTKHNIQDGTIVTKQLTEQTTSTIEITTNIIKGIEELAQKTLSIGSIINTIKDISKHTNLLSLNASIEAARAGEYGKGFGVVADEIRNLADQTNQSVNHIQKIIEAIQSDTKELVNTAKKAETVMVQQDTAVKNTSSSYQGINESVDNLMIHLKNITDNVNNIEEARSSTLNLIENISAVLEEIAASTNSVTQISSDQLQSVEALNQSAGNLSTNSEQLVGAIHKFAI